MMRFMDDVRYEPLEQGTRLILTRKGALHIDAAMANPSELE